MYFVNKGTSNNCLFDCNESGSPKLWHRLSHYEIGEICDVQRYSQWHLEKFPFRPREPEAS